MTRYRLPASLGGIEYDGHELPDGMVALAVSDIGPFKLVLPRDAVTEVPPPVPDEPEEPGIYLINETVTRKGTHAGSWEIIGHTRWHDWKDVCAYARCAATPLTVQRLVPAPVPLPDVELPWSHTDMDGDRLRIGGDGRVVTMSVRAHRGETYEAYLDSHEARVQAAAAILAADREIGGE
jgi:hypothetical protein